MADYWKRPKIKIAKTKGEWIWDIIGYSLFTGAIILLILKWGALPEEVPAHYNARGEVDRWGSKWELLTLPGIGAFTILLMQVFEKYPETHNYPQRMNDSNVKEFYLNSRKMINIIKNLSLILFALILFESVSIALGWGDGFGKWFLPLTIIGLGIPLIAGIWKQRNIK
ncbi:DUF1648 domain-containing protein [Bacillus salacetis]|uniref:DUF1648 domain-containing protein n=1 Tax=Bacillus salacetis TaxID=2315464 RepID=A0A3A1QW70_9BACI|nr:DUF1648 domain-containing protein [Bacillus salacetis]RIW30372.1 DUF1648 domain-containing protein [Bacillus salacetis]